jgi:hypothetical protein
MGATTTNPLSSESTTEGITPGEPAGASELLQPEGGWQLSDKYNTKFSVEEASRHLRASNQPLPAIEQGESPVANGKLELVPVSETATSDETKLELVPVLRIHPAPENDMVYGAISWDDPDIVELARSIKAHGILHPLTISKDHYIISGHRRRIAAIKAGLTELPVKVYPVSHRDQPEEFMRLLVEANSQHQGYIRIDPRVVSQAGPEGCAPTDCQ